MRSWFSSNNRRALLPEPDSEPEQLSVNYLVSRLELWVIKAIRHSVIYLDAFKICRFSVLFWLREQSDCIAVSPGKNFDVAILCFFVAGDARSTKIIAMQLFNYAISFYRKCVTLRENLMHEVNSSQLQLGEFCFTAGMERKRKRVWLLGQTL